MELKKTFSNILEKFNSNKIFNWFKEKYLILSKKRYVPFIFFMYCVAFVMFFYTLIRNQFTIPVSGDFTLQEIPFYFNGYDDWWTFFKTGKFVLWDDSAMLGVNNVGANSFYYLFNPFMDKLIRFFFISTPITLTSTISPTLTASRGCLINLSVISEMCTRPS